MAPLLPQKPVHPVGFALVQKDMPFLPFLFILNQTEMIVFEQTAVDLQHASSMFLNNLKFISLCNLFPTLMVKVYKIAVLCS